MNKVGALLHDLRYAVRKLRASPGFTAAAVLTLGLGIGINTGIFSVAYSVLWQPLPFADPDRLVYLWHRTGTGAERMRIAGPDVAEFRRSAQTFEGFAFTNNVLDAALSAGEVTEHARLSVVTSNFFDVLGARAALGRTFLDNEGIIAQPAPGNAVTATPPTALILSHALWRSRFGQDRRVIGQTVRVNGVMAVVVGVMPQGFEVPMPVGVGLARDIQGWTPIRVDLESFRRPEGLRDRDSDNTGAVIGRLRPHVTLAQAQAEMDVIAARQRETIPVYREHGTRIEVTPQREDAVAHTRGLLLALLGAAGCVLLVACLNVASLTLARGSARHRELAVRAALGASRARLTWQLVMESVPIAVLGCAVGVVLAAWTVPVLLQLAPTDVPLSASIRVNPATLVFSTAVSVLALVVFGALPALTISRDDRERALRSRGPGEARSRFVHRRLLVIAEIALSMAVLVGGGLMVRSLSGLRREDPGFRAPGATTFRVSLRGSDRYRGPAGRSQFLHELSERVKALPGVVAVGSVAGLPLSGEVWTQPYASEVVALEGQSLGDADFRVISSGYFEAIGTRLLAGRTFTADEDVSEERRVAVVDARMARRLAPSGGSVLGRSLAFPLDGRPVSAEIVGVVEHVRHERLDRDGRETIYVPYRQEAPRDVSMVVRTTGDPTGLERQVEGVLAALDPTIPAYEFRTMREYVGSALAPVRFVLTLLSSFGVLALIIACVGLYGLLAFTVGRRTHEFGIRIALGARSSDVMRSILVEGGVLGAAGLAVGILLSAGMARLLSGMLFGVRPLDATTYAGIALLLAVSALVACYIPARRAARVDPMVALRNE